MGAGHDILDVWFDSGSTHAFVLEQRPDLKWPADLYLEGSDQHRGWFQSSLLEACGTRGRAPYDAVVTHGFVVDEDGRKMSKSLGNVVAPQDVIRQSGAEILRLWAMSSDYAEDLRIGPEIIKANVESYRKLRNTLRYLLGNLAHYQASLAVPYAEMPELERYMLSRLAELNDAVREGYWAYDFKRAFHALLNFCRQRSLRLLFRHPQGRALLRSLRQRDAPRGADRARQSCSPRSPPGSRPCSASPWRRPGSTASPAIEASVHLRQFPEIPSEWRNDALAEKWRKVRAVRRVVTGALEIERKEGRIGSSLEAAPKVYVADKELRAALSGVDLAEIAITSGARLMLGEGPEDAFRLDDVKGVAVVFERAQGHEMRAVLEDPRRGRLGPRVPRTQPARCRSGASVRFPPRRSRRVAPCSEPGCGVPCRRSVSASPR